MSADENIDTSDFDDDFPPMGETWKDSTDTHVLMVYLQMAMDAGSESMFKATIRLIVELVDEVDYLGDQGK